MPRKRKRRVMLLALPLGFLLVTGLMLSKAAFTPAMNLQVQVTDDQLEISGFQFPNNRTIEFRFYYQSLDRSNSVKVKSDADGVVKLGQVIPVGYQGRVEITATSERSYRYFQPKRTRTVNIEVGERGGKTVALPAIQPPTGASSATPRGSASETSTSRSIHPGLPFKKLAAESRSKKKVFAHYFTPYPLSMDNEPPANDYYATEYLNPHGENDKFLAQGGLLRDRPIPVSPRSGQDWELQNLKQEIRTAQAAGVDGFTVNIMGMSEGSSNWKVTRLLFRAADELNSGFNIVIMPDATVLTEARYGSDKTAQALAELAKYKSAYRLADGSLVISPFHAENRTPQWWSDVFRIMKSQYGIATAFVPTFLDYFAHAAEFASISYGFSHWGHRTPQDNATLTQFAADAHKRGKIWMQPVSVQDQRPNQSVFDDSRNTANLRVTWQGAIDGAAEWVQLVTWNDYSEGTSFAPSLAHSSVFLDLSAYYIYAWKTGVRPAIERDAIVLTHRNQLVSATPLQPSSKPMRQRPGVAPARDELEAVVFLTSPAAITINAGGVTTTKALDSGLHSVIVPLQTGRISATITRQQQPILTLKSPTVVTSRPKVQDMQLWASSTFSQAR